MAVEGWGNLLKDGYGIHIKLNFCLQWGKCIVGNENHNEQWDMSKKIHLEQTKYKMSILSYSLLVGDIAVDKMDILCMLKDT